MLNAISDMPEKSTMADYQYRLYVVNKVLKSEKSIHDNGSLSHEAVGKKLRKWIIK